MPALDIKEKNTLKGAVSRTFTQDGALAAARHLAGFHFWNQKDTTGPVMAEIEALEDPDMRIAGYLRSVISNIPGWTGEDLRHIGFDQSAIRAAGSPPSLPASLNLKRG
jgi:hypothetical protein